MKHAPSDIRHSDRRIVALLKQNKEMLELLKEIQSVFFTAGFINTLEDELGEYESGDVTITTRLCDKVDAVIEKARER